MIRVVQGSTGGYAVRVDGSDLSDWKSSWPASGLQKLKSLVAAFDKNGDLVDLIYNDSPGIGSGKFDGPALLALTHDMQCVAVEEGYAHRSHCGHGGDHNNLPLRQSVKNMRKNGHGAPVDHAAAGELKLYIDNDRETYEKGRMYRAALAKRMQKGTFNLALAAKGFGWIVEEGAKKYTKEFGGTWHSMFSPATREVVAKEMAQEWYEEYRAQHPTKNTRRKRTSRRNVGRMPSLPAGYTVYEQRGRLGEDPRYRWNWKTAAGDVGMGYRTERQARAAAVGSVEYLTRIGAHMAALRQRTPNARRKRTSRRNGRWKVWTGPTQVRQVADAYRAFPGVTDVLAGTEHVHFTYDGDLGNLTKVGVPSLVRAYAIGLGSDGRYGGHRGVQPVRNGRKRTSRRNKRTSRRSR